MYKRQTLYSIVGSDDFLTDFTDKDIMPIIKKKRRIKKIIRVIRLPNKFANKFLLKVLI